jgi:hypothetical protein
MRWFRLRQRWGTCLALAALIVQLVVASGHIHLEFGGHDHDHDHIVRADPHGHAAGPASAHEPVEPDDKHAPHHDRCAACTLVQLAQSLLSPAAPVLALPHTFALQHENESSAALTAPTAAHFRARAPPLA